MKTILKSLLLLFVAAPMFFSACKTIETVQYVYCMSNANSLGSNAGTVMDYVEDRVNLSARQIITSSPDKVEEADAQGIAWFNGLISAIDDDKLNALFERESQYYTINLYRVDSDGQHLLTSKTWRMPAGE